MNFKSKWYSAENKPLEIPTFLDLQNVTGQVFDDFGNYIGKKDLPEQQLIINEATQRQYYAPKEYDDDAIRYAQAKIDESFRPEDWYGMTRIKPHFKLDEQIIGGAASAGKEAISMFAQIPTKLVYAGTVGLNYISRGNFENAENLYRYSMKNWEDTLTKYGLANEPEIREMLGGKIGTTIGGVAGSLLTAAAVSSVGGLPAVAAVFGGNQFSEIMEEGLAKGLPHDKAVLAAFLAAVPEGGLEALGFKLWKGAATLNKSFVNRILAFVWEGAQEGSQQTAESIITNSFGIRQQTFMEIIADIALSALIGGLVGFAGAEFTGQVEQRNVALRKDIGMDDAGRIVPQKPTEQKNVQNVRESQNISTPEALRQMYAQEIAEAKKTGDNKLYNSIKFVANSYDITDEGFVDKLYPICSKMIADGGTFDTLLDILGNQVVAYKNQLESGQTDTKATQKAVEQIKLAVDPNRHEEWKESRKSELEKAGLSKEQAGTLSEHISRIAQNLSNRLGFDITQKYDVSFEKRAPMSETLKGIKEREEGDISFNFGANAKEEVLTPFQEGRKTQAELLEAKRSIEQGLRAQKSAPRSTLLSLLRRVGANYAAANRIDKEAYKNAGIKNNKSGIGDELAFFLRDNGFMSFDDPQTYEDKARLEDEAADLIDRALSGENIYSLENQALADEVAMAEESREQAEQELRNINIDLTRGQISFLGKVAKIALGETFDFTTLEHEFFHFLDKVVLDAAKEGNPEAQKLVKKRNDIIQKAKADLKKRGIKDMPIDEEILASAYEKWLWQGGKSDDAYEQRLFNAIREFFREVYDTVKGLMGIRITPEADAYFRAMTGEGPNTFYQFAGQNAMTADRLALNKAKEMETSGADNETIRQETGWFKGVDGKWRFEISDSDASVSKAVKTLKKDAIESTEKFNKKIDEFNKKLHKLSDEKKTEEYEKVMDQKLSYIEEQKKPKEKTFKLGDFLQHETLYKAYPELKELRLDIKPMKPNEAGGYSERRKLIELNASLVMTSTEESTKKTLLHEIAHYIQHRENFAVGGSPSQFRSKRMNPAAKRMDFKRSMDSAILYNKLVAAKTKGLKTNLNWPSAAYVEQFLPELEKLAKEDEAVRATLADWKEANEKLKEYDNNTALMKYKRLGGEIEARNVEERSEFTPLETAMISPESTQDIKNADAIVVFGDGTELSYTTTESPNIYYQQETQDQLFRNDQATKHGNKVLDKAPTNEEVEKELEAIRSGRVEEAQKAKKNLGLIDGLGDALLTVRQRVGVIDKRLKFAFDRMDFNEKMMESEYGKQALGYLKKYRKLSDVEKDELDYLLNNQQHERVREFMRDHDMLQEYTQVRKLLDTLYEEGNRAGMDMGFLEEYFPTKVADYKAFISHLMGTEKWSEIELALNQIDPKHQMSEEERSDAINSILRGYNRTDPISKQGFQKERKIFHKTPEMMKYYMRSDEALMRYISGMSSALAMRKAFNVKGAFNSEESIGAVVNELIRSGKITQKEEAFIKRMLKARLNYARTAPIVSLIKNFGYLGTMNNITSAVTQIGDLYAVFYKYNFPTAMKAIFGKADITKDDLYLDSIWEEFNKDNWSGVAVDKLFTAIGLNKLDKLGKNTAIDGAWIDLKERARKNDVSLLEDLTAAFGSRAGKVLSDIKNNNVTFDVKQLLWSQLADTQPIGKSGVPVAYLNSPHMRVLYQLKTYTINQLSLFYADGLYKIRKGIATKNKKLFLQGTGNIMKLALLLTVFNAGADVLKNLIMGRSIEISDTLVSNLIWNIGVSKYTFYRGQRDGYARALVENFLPPQISMADDAFMDAKKIYKGNRKPSDTVAVTYVPYGRMWYWWFGGGRTSEKKKGNKPFQVKL